MSQQPFDQGLLRFTRYRRNKENASAIKNLRNMCLWVVMVDHGAKAQLRHQAKNNSFDPLTLCALVSDGIGLVMAQSTMQGAE